jgi:hypothetical protein
VSRWRRWVECLLRLLSDRHTPSHDTAAVDAGTRRDELLAEQQLRTTMPDVQRGLEHQLRTVAIQRHLAQAAPEPSIHAELDYLQRSVQTGVHRDIDRGGPSLSR